MIQGGTLLLQRLLPVEIFKTPGFTRLFAVSALAAGALAFFYVGSALLLVENGSTMALAVFLTVQAIAQTAFLYPAAFLVRRLNPRLLMSVGYACTAIGALILGGNFYLTFSLASVVSAAAFVGFGAASAGTASRVLLFQFIRSEGLEEARGTLLTVTSLMAAICPSLAALISSTWGVGVTLSVSAVALVAACAVLSVSSFDLAVGGNSLPANDDDSHRYGLRAALQHATSTPWMVAGMLQNTLLTLLVFAPMAIAVRVVAIERYGEIGFGLVLTGEALGGIIGTLVSTKWRPEKPGLMSAVGFTCYGLMTLTVIISVPVFVMFLAALVSSFSIKPNMTWWFGAVSRATPRALQGEIHALDLLGPSVAEPAGFALATATIGMVSFPAVAGAALISIVVFSVTALAVPGYSTFGQSRRCKQDKLTY